MTDTLQDELPVQEEEEAGAALLGSSPANLCRYEQADHSPMLDKLFAALAKAQGEIKAAMKDRTNPFFGSDYSSLDAIWAACRGPLSKNGLSVPQPLSSSDNGEITILTFLGHESGQYMISRITLKPAKIDAQELGKAITYARRYALAAMVGVAPGHDDDGEASKGKQDAKDVGGAAAKTRSTGAAPRPDKKSSKQKPSETDTILEDWLDKIANADARDIDKIAAELKKKGLSEEMTATLRVAWNERKSILDKGPDDDNIF